MKAVKVFLAEKHIEWLKGMGAQHGTSFNDALRRAIDTAMDAAAQPTQVSEPPRPRGRPPKSVEAITTVEETPEQGCARWMACVHSQIEKAEAYGKAKKVRASAVLDDPAFYGPNAVAMCATRPDLEELVMRGHYTGAPGLAWAQPMATTPAASSPPSAPHVADDEQARLDAELEAEIERMMAEDLKNSLTA